MPSDRNLISTEDHELNYVLKKWNKKQSKKNREILVEKINDFNNDESYAAHNRKNFYRYVKDHDILKLLESTDKEKKKGLWLWIILLIIILLIIIFLILFGLTKCRIDQPVDSTQDKEMMLEKEKDTEVLEKEMNAKIENLLKENTPIFFIKDRAILLDGEDAKINNIITGLKEFNNISLSVIGHTAKIGKPDREMKLSVQRAILIKGMISNGLGDKNITFESQGMGAKNEAVPSSDKTQRHLNRRVEIKLKK